MRNAIGCLLLLPALLTGGEEWDLSNPTPSPRAKRMRKQARALWKQAKPTCDRIVAVDSDGKKRPKRRWGEKRKKEEPKEPVKAEDIDREAVAEAVEKLELAAMKFERSLGVEWNDKANLTLCDVITAWYAAQPYLPKSPVPEDEKEKKRAESKARKTRSKQMGAARKILMELGAARRYANLYRRCPRCEGRKDLRNPLDKTITPCPTCKRTGLHVNRKGVVKALWLFHSPFFRADSRRQVDVNRKLRNAKYDTKRLAPFTKSVSIAGKPDFHGTWIRIKTREKVHNDPAGRRVERTEAKYELWRMGKLWYIYHARYDKQIIEIPEEPEEPDDEDEDS